MYIKKKYSKILSLLIILAIFINITAIIPVKNARAEEVEGIAETTEEAGMVLYKSGKAEGEYVSLEDALNAMTDPKGDYEIVFNKNKEEYTLYGDIELPEVSSIKLSGVYEMYEKDSVMTQYLTRINVNSNIYLNSDLTIDNIYIYYNNEMQNSMIMLNWHTLTIQGEQDMISSNGRGRLQITGNDDSCLVINNTTYEHYSDITVGTIILKNGAILGCFGDFNKIQNLFSYSNEPAKYNYIYFNSGFYYDTYSSIENIGIYASFSLGIYSCKRMDIGSIKQYMDIDSVDINVDYYKYRADTYCHLNIKEDTNAELQIRCSLQEFSEKDYKMFRDISHLCAPNVPVSKINYIFDCKEHPEWKAGDVFKDIEGNIWLEPVEEKEEEALCYKLDEQSRDGQKIFYSLDTENKTATVGKDSDVLNTAGYKGANNGCVVIPSYVEKDGIKYIVNRIGSNSFANGNSIMRMEIPDTVKSIGKKAFWGIGIDEIYIGSDLESIGEDALSATAINRIYADPANQHFFSYKNVLFDIECETLIKCSYNYSFFGDGCYIVPYPIRTIADGAFKNTGIKNIILSDSVTVIGKEAFSNCFYLESFSGNQVGEIKERAFSECCNLKYFNAGTNLKRVGKEVFFNCTSLEWLLFPDSKMVIEDKAFCNIRNLKYFIGARNAEYGTKLFGDCENLSLVSLSEYMESIPEGLFAGCSSLEKIYIPEQYTDCALSAFTGNIYEDCTAYGTDEQKKFLTKAFVDFENKSEHEHIMVTETIAEPGERTYGAEVTYCTYCHYIEEGKLISPTDTQTTIPTISRPVLKTPAPVANETPEPGILVTPVPEETEEPGNTIEPPSSSEPPEDNNTGSNGGSSSGGGGGASSGGGGFASGGGGAGAAGGGQPAATQTPVPSESPSSQPVLGSATPQATPGVTVPTAEPSQAPSPSSSPGLDNTYGQIRIYSFSLKLDKNNHAKLKWNKNPYASGYVIYRSTKRDKNFDRIHTIKNPSKNFYTDKKVSPDKRYYYRICAYRLYGESKYTGKYSSTQSIKTLYLIKPKIKAVKKKTAGNIKYIQLDLKKYSGTDIAVYIRGNNKKYKRLELIESSIKKYNASFKLRYNSKKKTCYIKVKTFINKNGQKYYSAYSNVAKVKM